MQLTKQGGGNLTEADANGLICHSFGVDTIQQLKTYQLPEATDKAAKLIGLFMIEQDVSDDFTTPTITTKDEDNIKRAISLISHSQFRTNAWTQGAWYAIRKATGRKSPQKFKTKDLPIIAVELERALVCAIRFNDFVYASEEATIHQALRCGTDLDQVIAEHAEANKNAWQAWQGMSAQS